MSWWTGSDRSGAAPRAGAAVVAVLLAAGAAAAHAPAACPPRPGTTTDPEGFATVTEVAFGGRRHPATELYGFISDRSGGLEIELDEEKMAGLDPECAEPQVILALEAHVVRGGERTLVAPIDNYVSRREVGTGKDRKVEIDFHEQVYLPGEGGDIVPDALVDLAGLDLATVDRLELRLTNLVTQESLERILAPRPFGFRARVTDAILFVQRQGVSRAEVEAGVDDFNFGPAPGVTYGGSFLPRASRAGRVLQPGFGLTVSFMDWDDPAFDVASGMFVAGTKSNDIEVGLGVQVSLFRNLVQLVYGWNLNVDQDRNYLGVGVSFVDVTSKLKGLVAPARGGG